MAINPPILTFWNSTGERILDAQFKALKTLLNMVGSIFVRKMADGTIQAKFKSWDEMEKANKDVLNPLQCLFSIKTIESSFGIVHL